MLAHVTAIQEGGNIRTTPRGSPRSSTDLETYYTASQPRNSAAPTPALTGVKASKGASLSYTPGPTPNAEHSEDDEGTPTPTPSSPYAQIVKPGDRTKEQRRSHLGRPPPILKNAGSSGSAKSASMKSPVIAASQIGARPNDLEPCENTEKSPLILPQRDLESRGSPPAPRYVSTRFSEQVAVSIPHVPKSTMGGKGEKSARSLGEPGQKPRKKDHMVHAGPAAGRKRPIVMRQRSSQTSFFGKPSPTSPRLGARHTPEDDDKNLEMASSIERKRTVGPHPGTGKSRRVVEAPSDEEEEAFEDPAAEATTRENTKESASIAKCVSPLVEPDFRSKFADRSQTQHRSFTNLPSAAWRSAAIAPTAASYQASGMMIPEQETTSGRRGSGRAAFHDQIVPLKAPAPAGPATKETTDNVTPLPRTKSQLTLLLERNKVAGQDNKGKGSGNL